MQKAKMYLVSLLNQFGVNLNHKWSVTPPMLVLETNLVQISHMGKNVPFGFPITPVPIMQNYV